MPNFRDSITGAMPLDIKTRNGVQLFDFDKRGEVTIKPVARRMWLPWEITMDTAGLDGRTDAYRWISPGDMDANPAAAYTAVYSTEGCTDLKFTAIIGRTVEAYTAVNFLCYMGQIGGTDGINNMDYINPIGAGVNAIVTSTTLPTFWHFHTADQVTTSGQRARMDTGLYWCVKIDAPVGGIPVTLYVQGR